MVIERRLVSASFLLVAMCATVRVTVEGQRQQSRSGGQPVDPASELVLTIEEPADWSATGSVATRGITANVRSSIRVEGTAKHPHGVEEVLLNKNRASLVELPDGSTRFVGYIRVEERMTSAEIEVVTKTGEQIRVRYNITATVPPKVERPADRVWADKSAEAGFKGKRWAVVIGISHYEDADIPSLKYADADAKAFYDFLRSPLAGMGGFDPSNVRLLLNEEATYRNMRVALFDFLKNATADDVVYIYFAGHGSPDPQRLENLYLLPYDARANSIGGTSFPMEDMNKALRQVSAAHKILITDACHSGGVTGEGARAGITINQINEAFLDRVSASAGVNATFTASGPAETSAEGEQWGGGHGVFTHYLLEGLSGAADADGDHLVDLQEMIDYTTSNVVRATAGAQHPMTGATAYDQAFPVGLVVAGTTITPISMEEIKRANKDRSITDKADETPWLPLKAPLMVVGMPESLRVHLETPEQEIIPPSWLTWSTNNPLIATVDSAGRVNPLAAGTVTITAARGARKADVAVQVLPLPSDVRFSPSGDTVPLVLTERIHVQTDLLIGTDQWLLNIPPRVGVSDTLVLKPLSALEYVASREGTATVHASIGGKAKDWTVSVVPPGLKIKAIPVVVPIDDSLPLAGSRIRPNGTTLGDAANVAWASLDTTRVVVQADHLIARGIGKARIVGTLGAASDTVSTFVLGDLLIGTEGQGARTIRSVAIGSGQTIQLLPPNTVGSEPALSPKGDRIAFVSGKRIYVMDADGSNVHRLTPDMRGLIGTRMSSYEEHSPHWISDESRVVFISNAPGNYEVMSVTAEGKDVQRVTDDAQQERHVAAAIDMPEIAFERVLAFDQAEVVIALGDGSQPHAIPVVQATERLFSPTKPAFLPGGRRMVIVKKWPGREGESLAIVTTDDGATEKDLTREQRDYGLIYAVSPDGRYIAYHSTTDWAKKNSLIAITDRNGTVLKTINVGAGLDITSIGWGASLVRPTEAK